MNPNDLYKSENSFLRQYLETAIWADLDEEFLDKGLSIDDLSPCSIIQAKKDCESFLEKIDGLSFDDNDLSDVAHNFWLNRCGHGVGFWDGDYPTDGDKLDKIAKSYGELYVSYNDSVIYVGI